MCYHWNAEPADSIEQLLQESDVVTLHVPATSSTRNMIGESEIQQMKPGSFLLNNARGNVVDLDALRAALLSGHLCRSSR